MSAQEFGEWTVMYRAEQLHPAADRLRHAQLLAAAHNGPVTRKGSDKRPFAATEFMPPDAWVLLPAAQPAAVSPAKAAAKVAAEVAAINNMLRKDRRK